MIVYGAVTGTITSFQVSLMPKAKKIVQFDT